VALVLEAHRDPIPGERPLEVDSRTAVRTANELIGAGVQARLALEPFETSDGDMPAGSILFADGARAQVRAAGPEAGLWFEPVSGLLPRRERIDRVPRIACLCSALENWALEARLGFVSEQYTNTSIGSAPTDPLTQYDVIYNTNQGYPTDDPEDTPEELAVKAAARERYAAFFAGGGRYVGARSAAPSSWRRRRAARSWPVSRPSGRAGAHRWARRPSRSMSCSRCSAGSARSSRRT
jgi:hypothetical protein